MAPGQVHILVLMLFAAGMIEPALADGLSPGTGKRICLKDVMVQLCKQRVGKGESSYDDFVINDDTKWEKFNSHS